MNLAAQWTALLTIWRKETIRYLRIWPQTLVPSAITIVLYFMIFGHVIGGRIGLMEGLPYMTYIMPGLIMMAVITSAYANVVSSFFGARFNRSIEELFISPVSSPLIIIGFLGGGLGRGLIVGLIVSTVGLGFSGWHVVHVGLTVLIFFLCSILFSLAGLINGIFARKFDDTSIVTTFILGPLIYLGGIFYPISALPPVWREISLLNPLHYVISVFRYAMLGIDGSGFFPALGVVVVLVVALFAWAFVLLEKGKGIKV
jgi:ABC-2 type transport system permease protein